MAEREREVEKKIRLTVEGMGGEFWKLTCPSRAGVPDRLCIMPDGRVIFVELKTEIGILEHIQKYQIARLRDLHQQVCIVYGKKAAEEFIRDLKDHVVSSMVYDSEGSYEI